MKSKLHLFSIVFFLLCIRLENCHSFSACMSNLLNCQLGSIINPSSLAPQSTQMVVSERNNLLMCLVSFDVTEQKNLYRMMIKGGMCFTGAGFIYSRLQLVLLLDGHASFSSFNSHPYHQSRDKEKKLKSRKPHMEPSIGEFPLS